MWLLVVFFGAQVLDGQGRAMLDPLREQALHPAALVARLAPAPTATVVDVGAGPGFLTLPLARAVPRGRVIAGDVRDDYLQVAAQRARDAGLRNVETRVWPRDRSLLDPRSVDLAILCQVDQLLPDRAAYLAQLAPALKPGGRVVVINLERHRAAVLAAAAQAGYRLVDEFRPSPPYVAVVLTAPSGGSRSR
jgi:ubiquinone/menaquinone biosynthesis C-methylase UbiE